MQTINPNNSGLIPKDLLILISQVTAKQKLNSVAVNNTVRQKKAYMMSKWRLTASWLLILFLTSAAIFSGCALAKYVSAVLHGRKERDFSMTLFCAILGFGVIGLAFACFCWAKYLVKIGLEKEPNQSSTANALDLT